MKYYALIFGSKKEFSPWKECKSSLIDMILLMWKERQQLAENFVHPSSYGLILSRVIEFKLILKVTMIWFFSSLLIKFGGMDTQKISLNIQCYIYVFKNIL